MKRARFLSGSFALLLGLSGSAAAQASSGCVDCHVGIEEMHPEAALSCVDCHGGNGEAKLKRDAHVRPPENLPKDERVAALDEALTWRRFRNPMDLRVVERTCGECHVDATQHLMTSLHATTAGHLSDGFFEAGLFAERGSRYSIFRVAPDKDRGGELESLVQVPAFQGRGARDALATHYADLARKECMQCHLYSEGRALQGRVGFDGDYRGEGCAACHVAYELDGLSRSADERAVRGEPGHPSRHVMSRAPTTQTCTSCHYGDASIGLHFRGLSQLPPGAPGGPDIPGTTDSPLNRVFYVDDPALTPPDLHHERGMHCIDCHTVSDVMGDGELHGQMEHAVEIACSDCHGTFTEASKLRTERGTPLTHLFRDGDRVVLRSKVDGALHDVPQVVHVLDAARPEYNARAAEAMTGAHGRVECYTCHAGWNINFLGFHFDRNESLTQLDLLSGRRTPGRVTTQEKVFSSWKSFYAGLNSSGRFAPYLTGFSTMGSVRDQDGELILDQVLPETANGLSGMTMIHHQLHSTRPTARSCVECHRSPTTWGLGSSNFRLARRLAVVADRRGLEVVAVERGQLAASAPLAKLVLPDIVALELANDPLQGQAQRAYAAEGGRGIHVVDLADPTAPRRLAFRATVNPGGMQLVGEHLYVADGVGGLKIFDASRPDTLELIGVLPMFDAYDVHVQWPWAYVADGPGGLAIVDVRAAIAPKLLATLDVNGEAEAPNEAVAVAALFQNSRPIADGDTPLDRRTEARNLCAVLDRTGGLALVDVTQPERPRLLSPRGGRTRATGGEAYRGLALASHVDVAEATGGGKPTRESDYAYVSVERRRRNGRVTSRLEVWDVGNPLAPRRVGNLDTGGSAEMLRLASWYNPPFLQTTVLIPGADGVLAMDVSNSEDPKQAGSFPGIVSGYVVEVEEFPLDKMLDEAGRPLKDVSHEGARWLYRAEIERLLSVSSEALGLEGAGERRQLGPGTQAREFLAQYDKDRSGLLEAGESEPALLKSFDQDGDGRLVLIELAGSAGLLAERTEAYDETPTFKETRVDQDGDLSRLLDGVNPFDHDRDENRRLDRDELKQAFFEALDLDASGGLDQDELSRHPGPLRDLRYRDAAALAAFQAVDRNRNGRVSKSEFNLRDEDWRAIDVDADGGIQLPETITPLERRLGFVGRQSEWPTRRVLVSGLPPLATPERLLATFDTDKDGVLTQRELRARPDLYEELERDGDGRVDADELEARIDQVTARGVDAAADDFLGRWDLNGDGKVDAGELSAVDRLMLQRRAKRP